MNENFTITAIKHVIFIGEAEEKEIFTEYRSNLFHNELILHLSGKSIVNFNGKQLICEPGSIRFLPKGQNNEYTVTRQEFGECLDVFFDTDCPISEEAFMHKIKNSTLITGLFKKLFSVWVAKGDGYYFKCLALLYEIFAELQKKNYIPDNQYKAIKPAIDYMNENFIKEKITVEFLARHCGISESYLKKLFIKKFGVPPVKYLIQLKINYACDLLRSKIYSISQVAELCGYNNVYFFSRQFKEYMGVSHTEFIKRNK